MTLFSHIRFLTTVNALKQLPATSGLEVAFAGRSNAGKSSAINALANQTRLAHVSKTPGRTQHINYFTLDDKAKRYIVDLPGYGYAQVPHYVQQHWASLLSGYLQKRGQLMGLVILMDIRRPLTKLDCQMLDWFTPLAKPILILLTKADKLAYSQAKHTVERVKRLVASDQCTVQLFSSLKKVGICEAQAVLESWFIAAEKLK